MEDDQLFLSFHHIVLEDISQAVDIFSQYRFLDPTIFGMNFYAFRGRYCVMGGFNRKQIVQYRDLDALIKKPAQAVGEHDDAQDLLHGVGVALLADDGEHEMEE